MIVSGSKVQEIILRIKSSLKIIKNRSIENLNWENEIFEMLSDLAAIKAEDLDGMEDYLYLRAAVADYLDRIFSFYQDGRIDLFELKLRRVINRFEFQESFFFNYSFNLGEKEIPGFLDSCHATLDRLITINNLSLSLSNLEGVIIGGSISYGRFYSVRKSRNSHEGSDIDSLLIYKDLKELESLTKVPVFDQGSREIFGQRLQGFASLKSSDFRILSQRFSCLNHGSNISFHCLNIDLARNIAENLERDLSSNQDLVYFVTDFRGDPFKEDTFSSRSFDGAIYEVPLEKVRKSCSSYVSNLPVYSIHKGEFYSSLYFNLILPEMWALHDKEEFTSTWIDQICSVLKKRLEQEKKAKQSKFILKSHIRYPVFRRSICDRF